MGTSYVAPKYSDPGYEAAKQRSLKANTGAYDSVISQASNKSAMAGNVAGVANTGRLAADTFANISSQKANRASAIEDQYNNYELQHKAAFLDMAEKSRVDYENNKPGLLDYVTGGLGIVAGGMNIASGLGFNPFTKKPAKMPLQSSNSGGGYTSGTGSSGSYSNNMVPPPPTFNPSMMNRPTASSWMSGWNGMENKRGFQWKY
jgi:hypothetical protein